MIPPFRRQLVLAVLSTGTLILLAASPQLLGGRVADALAGLGDAEPTWLWLAALLFVSMHALSGLAWGVALRSCGSPIDHADAIARYGVGSGLNAVAPFRVGSAVRVALFARVSEIDGALWQAGGAGAAVGAVRAVWFASLVGAAAAADVVPAWPLAVIAIGIGAGVVATIVSGRVPLRRRLGLVLHAFQALSRAPRSLGAVAVLTATGLACKVAAVSAIVAALGIERPLLAALVVVPAIELAAVLPITPGNAGVASAAVAFALGVHGVEAATALAAGIAFGATEMLAAIAVGAAGALTLAGTIVRPALRRTAVGVLSAAVSLAFSFTVVLPAL